MKPLRRRAGMLLALFLLMTTLPGCVWEEAVSYTLEEVPAYTGEPWVILNENIPDFPQEDKTSVSFERYSQLDYFGRCGPAYANVGAETLPTEERGAIGQVKPSGWQTAKYDFVDGKYLYNRCHLIAYQLTAENANELNLITGTRYLNVTGMLPFENQVVAYIKETGNHVLYRSTPVFEGANLVARGVVLEGWSVEDEGAGICFHIYAYNVQPGVVIDYATGENRAEEGFTPLPEEETAAAPTADVPEGDTPHENGGAEDTSFYILNQNSKRFHLPHCAGAAAIKEENRQEYTGSRQSLIDAGYVSCGQCGA